MKNFYNKKIAKIITILMLFIIILNFILPINSLAFSYKEIGGTLFTPIRALICGIGDVIINLLQNTMLTGAPTAIDKVSISDFKMIESIQTADKERRNI